LARTRGVDKKKIEVIAVGVGMNIRVLSVEGLKSSYLARTRSKKEGIPNQGQG
jgi:hypothetical protein